MLRDAVRFAPANSITKQCLGWQKLAVRCGFLQLMLLPPEILWNYLSFKHASAVPDSTQQNQIWGSLSRSLNHRSWWVRWPFQNKSSERAPLLKSGIVQRTEFQACKSAAPSRYAAEPALMVALLRQRFSFLRKGWCVPRPFQITFLERTTFVAR